MFKAYKYRLYPTEAQISLLNEHLHSCRLVYNLALEVKRDAYSRLGKSLSRIDLQKQLPALKAAYPWLNKVNSQSLQSSIRRLDQAFENFFTGRSKYPRFKSKKQSQSFECPQNNRVDFQNRLLFIPKFSSGIRLVVSRTFTGSLRKVTVSRTSTGKFFASILVEDEAAIPTKKPVQASTALGIDMGIKHFATLSTGLKVENPNFLKKKLRRLSILQRRASRKKKGSKNQKKAFQRIALLHEQIANTRLDFLHKLSTQLVNSHDTICLEDLAIRNMVKNHSLAQSILDAAWGLFAQMCKYKADWQGKNCLFADTVAPTSKRCCKCGTINPSLSLKEREWTCASCNDLLDRDTNAADNIKYFTLLKYSGREPSVVPVELPTSVGALKQEVF